MKRYKLIACKVLGREIGELMAQSENFIDITWLKQGLHNVPEFLRDTLQDNIRRIDAGDDPYTFVGKTYSMTKLEGELDAILIGYGLCSNGVVGIRSEKYPIVIPNAHDCITLFLGSKERYKQCFDEMTGAAFWYNPGWIENCNMPSEETYRRQMQAYADEYDEDTAEYLVSMENGWYKEYNYTAYILPENPRYPDYRDFARRAADFYSWEYREFRADNSLMQRMLAGEWDEEEFLVVPPGKTVVPSFDERVLRVGEPEEAAEYLRA